MFHILGNEKLNKVKQSVIENQTRFKMAEMTFHCDFLLQLTFYMVIVMIHLQLKLLF